MSRFARCERDTKETEIVIELDLDGTGGGICQTWFV